MRPIEDCAADRPARTGSTPQARRGAPTGAEAHPGRRQLVLGLFGLVSGGGSAHAVTVVQAPVPGAPADRPQDRPAAPPPQARHGPTARAAAGSGRPAPARPPAARTLAYDLQFGAFAGRGQLVWAPAGARYSARLEGRVAGLSLLQWASDGALGEAGLLPERFSDRRMGGRESSARFDRAAGVVRYSNGAAERVMPAEAQDRLSWMVQLAALAEGRDRPLAAGDRFALWVAGARGDGEPWSFRCVGRDGGSGEAGGATGAWRVVRETREADDTRVEVWLDPQRQHLPVRAVLQSARGDDRLELTLRQ